MSNSDIIKKEIFNLCKKYSSNAKDEDINKTVNLEIRKLASVRSSNVLDIIKIEKEIEDKMKKFNVSEITIIEMKSYIRKIQNYNMRDSASLIYFFSLMSKFGNDSTESSIQTFKSNPRIEMSDHRTSTPLNRNINNFNRLGGAEVSSISSTRSIVSRDYRSNTLIEPQRNNSSSITPRSHNYQISDELTECTVIGEMLFMIIGTDGKWLGWNNTLKQLSVRNGAILPFSMYEHVLQLCQCGTAYRRVRSYVEHAINNPSVGVVYQGLCVALNDHLTSYLNLVAALQSQYNTWMSEIDRQVPTNNELSLDILLLKLQYPTEILFCLNSILDKAGDLRGGQLASILYWHILHGTPDKVKLSRNLLLHAVEPFYNFIQQWLYDGILDESYQDFFVAISQNFDLNQTWTDKYGLRTPMIPKFISESEAKKILLTGKSINFLREVCVEKTTLRKDRQIMATMNVTAESMINHIADRSFENMINSVYIVTSEYLLKIMFEKYQLMDHIKALRKYMLHGQGDFILRMIEIIGPELSKPTDELKEIHMRGPLEMAIKSTNAQYDSREILDRIYIAFMRISDKETGWDIFTLNYQIADIRPLSAVISRTSFKCYLRAFNILFRSRRVHFILTNLFKKRNSFHHFFRGMSEVSAVLQFSHVMVIDMLHFVNQVQYYINFEVLECSWKQFMDCISKATDLDSVMKHHEYFLKQVTCRLLLEPVTRELLSNLRTIYDLIISFETILDEMFTKFNDELRFRISYKEQIAALNKQGKWGVDDRREKREMERITNFTKSDVLKFNNKLKAHNNQYGSHLVQFLSSIVDHKDSSLKRLYVNLDYNGRYKDRIREYRRTYNKVL